MVHLLSRCRKVSVCNVFFAFAIGIQMYLYMAQILEDNYPEMLKKLLVINGE